MASSGLQPDNPPPCSASTVKVLVCRVSGESVEFNVKRPYVVFGLKGRVAKHWHIPELCQELVLDGRQLHDSEPLFLGEDDLDPDQTHVFSVVVSEERLLEKMASKCPKEWDKAARMLAQWALHDCAAATTILDRIHARVAVAAFRQEPGFIPRGDDILVQAMTLQQAMSKALELRDCLGFTFRGEVGTEPVLVFFKRKAAVKGNGWTSFLIDLEDRTAAQRARILAYLRWALELPSRASEDVEALQAEAREVLRVSSPSDLELISLAGVTAKVWPDSVQMLVDEVLVRLLQRRRPGIEEPKLLKFVMDHTAPGDERLAAAHCAALQRGGHDSAILAARSLKQGLVPVSEAVLKALIAGMARARSEACVAIAETLTQLAPPGHPGAIAALRSRRDTDYPPARRKVERGLRRLTSNAQPACDQAAEGSAAP